jgi:hypothetical protein
MVGPPRKWFVATETKDPMRRLGTENAGAPQKKCIMAASRSLLNYGGTLYAQEMEVESDEAG